MSEAGEHSGATHGELRLRPLCIEDEREARAAHEELRGENFRFLLDWDPRVAWEAYVRALDRRRRGLAVPRDRVAATFLVAEANGELVGRVSIRHELNEFLLHEGGHIGYAVRPAYRRRGFATEMLRQAVVVARSHRVERVLITCDEGNLASAGVIERAGGALEDVRVGADGVGKRRYWIA